MTSSYGYITNVNHSIGADGRTVPISDSNPLNVSSTPDPTGGNLLSTGNTTTVNLLAGATFTGIGENILPYVTISIAVIADEDSANLGLEFQFSTDNITWVTSDGYSYFANGRKTYSIQRISQYFRVRYINGAINQSNFNISVIYNSHVGVASSHRIGDTISNEDDAQLTKSVLSAEKPTGDQVNIGATPEGALVTSVVTPTGTLPVSQLTTLHDGKILSRLFPEINEIQGTGTGAFQDNKYNMTVASGEWLVHQTKRFLPYYSGKPQKVELTFDNFAPETDVTKRVGYFSSNTTSPFDATHDGFYLESSGGSIKFVIKRGGVTVVETDIANWSGYDVLANYKALGEWDNFTVIEFNFLWLGGAYIEIRVVTEVGFTTVHRFIYAGTSQDVFMKSPNQPVRYEIRSTTGAGDFRYICNQVATSGSISESALSRSVNTGTSAITLGSVGTKYPVLSVRKQTALRVNPIRISSANLFVSSVDRVLWTLEINPTLSAPLSYSNVANSALSFASGNGTITVSAPGIIIASDYLTQHDQIPSSIFVNNYLSWLSGELDGTQDEYILCATPITNNVAIHGSIITLEG